MMEWLMEKKLAAMIERGLWFMDLGGEDYGPELLQSALELTTGFINRIPEFVWHDYGGRQPLRLPEPHVIRPAGFERQMEVKESV